MSGTTLDAINAQLAAAIYVAAGLGAGLAILAVGVGMLVMARAQTDSARAAGRRVILVGTVLTPVLLISRMLPGWFGLPDPDLPSAVTSTVTWGVGLGLVVATVGIGTLAATSLGDAGAAVGAPQAEGAGAVTIDELQDIVQAALVAAAAIGSH